MFGRPWTEPELAALRRLYHPGASSSHVAEALALAGFPRRGDKALAMRASKLGLTARRGQRAPEVAAQLHAEIVELREGFQRAVAECARLRKENRALRSELSQIKPYPLNEAGDLQPPLPFEVV